MDEEIKKLLEQNLEYSKEIYHLTKKIKNHVTFQKIMSLIWLILIVAPIILSIIYLPPLLNSVFDQYKSLLGGDQAGGTSQPIDGLLKGGLGGLNMDYINNLDSSQLPAEVRKLLGK